MHEFDQLVIALLVGCFADLWGEVGVDKLPDVGVRVGCVLNFERGAIFCGDLSYPIEKGSLMIGFNCFEIRIPALFGEQDDEAALVVLCILFS